MRKFKATKKDKKQVNDLAKKMPDDTEAYPAVISYTGKEIKTGKALVYSIDHFRKTGKLKEEKWTPPESQNIDDFEDTVRYNVHSVGVRKINHKRRMMKILEEKGWPGVINYMDPYLTEEARERMKIVE